MMDYGKLSTATPNYPKKYAQRTATSLRDGKNMKKWPKNRRKGLYEPENAIFGPIFRFSAPTGSKTA